MPLFELHEAEKQILEAIFDQFLKQICQDSPYKILVPATNSWSTAYNRSPNLEEFFAHIGGQQNLPNYLLSRPYEKYKSILESVARTTIIDSFDAILFPKETYDFPEQIAKVDTDALLNKIYGINCAIQHAVNYFWEILEKTSLPQTPEQRVALFEQVNDLLVEGGLFPYKTGHWDRDYTAIYDMTEETTEDSSVEVATESPEGVGSTLQGSRKRTYGASSEPFRKLKRNRLDIGIIWSDIPQQSFLSLLTSYLEQHDTDDESPTQNPNRGKYHKAIKLITCSKLSGSSELKHYETTRCLFLHFPRILHVMSELAKQRQVEFSGKTYFRGLRFDGCGELDLLLALIQEACAKEVTTTPYLTVTYDRERTQGLLERTTLSDALSSSDERASISARHASRPFE